MEDTLDKSGKHLAPVQGQARTQKGGTPPPLKALPELEHAEESVKEHQLHREWRNCWGEVSGQEGQLEDKPAVRNVQSGTDFLHFLHHGGRGGVSKARPQQERGG